MSNEWRAGNGTRIFSESLRFKVVKMVEAGLIVVQGLTKKQKKIIKQEI
jgi:hypothetical protein